MLLLFESLDIFQKTVQVVQHLSPFFPQTDLQTTHSSCSVYLINRIPSPSPLIPFPSVSLLSEISDFVPYLKKQTIWRKLSLFPLVSLLQKTRGKGLNFRNSIDYSQKPKKWMGRLKVLVIQINNTSVSSVNTWFSSHGSPMGSSSWSKKPILHFNKGFLDAILSSKFIFWVQRISKSVEIRLDFLLALDARPRDVAELVTKFRVRSFCTPVLLITVNTELKQ